MKEITKSAKTVEEAVKEALKELRLENDEVEIEVLEEASKGLFGFLGTKDAKVKVTERVVPEKRAGRILRQIFNYMEIEVEINSSDYKDYTKIDLSGPDLGILIGRRGDTLDSLQYYINLAANKKAEKRVKFIIDVEGYRQRRQETLSRLALKLADKAKRKGRNVVLEPMNPHERRVIHTALQDHKEVFTYSEGEEPYRKIIISPKK
ncbi:RNA-binding cell elongation regulator Jag/EloR [Phosphitispora fastidiosa]|uniref:RNA-binding cell elongation regulator Jag/EloR n=1 Tax=Phosphitispora fastidiosa TaxID=2837202 RepID=UPI001E5EAE2E|nr:RNA-binding cell elongation regulator Jag/EloR [Phosphitispora fastidiosa]MBU7007550.1 spoIIIJ-associated protein [Phosphitispora fastidiosa]